jgi:hypothetical protein
MERPPRTTPPDDEPGFAPRPNGEPRHEAGPEEGWRGYARDPYEEEGRPPPRPRPGSLDFSALFVLLDALRRAVPRDLDEQVTRLIREALLTLRSLIDWYLERLDRPRREPRVEDIPIE